MFSRCRFDLSDETLRIIEQIAKGAVMRVQALEARDLHFESVELLLEVSAVSCGEAGPDAERDILGSSGRLEEFSDLCRADPGPLCDVPDSLIVILVPSSAGLEKRLHKLCCALDAR